VWKIIFKCYIIFHDDPKLFATFNKGLQRLQMALVNTDLTFTWLCTPVRFLERSCINLAPAQIFTAGIKPGDSLVGHFGGNKTLMGQLEALGRAIKIDQKNSTPTPKVEGGLVKQIHWQGHG
jgi:hypothetical protein